MLWVWVCVGVDEGFKYLPTPTRTLCHKKHFSRKECTDDSDIRTYSATSDRRC